MNLKLPSWNKFWKRLWFPRPVEVHTLRIPSAGLDRTVRVDIYLPSRRPLSLDLPVAIFNDGQDLPTMRIVKRLAEQWRDELLPPMVIVGVHAGDRLREYGTADQLDYKGRGDRSAAYEHFLLEECLPRLSTKFPISRLARQSAIAGFSLGGLSAFDICWRNPQRFETAGVFSGALWWRSQPFSPLHPDADRILHTRVLRSDWRPNLRFWFQAGTHDETADRNRNGIIDAIDDTLQLMHVLSAKGYQEGVDMTYVEVEGGRHEPATWAEVLIPFLRWFAEGKLAWANQSMVGTPRL